jgi:hypothetical protein
VVDSDNNPTELDHERRGVVVATRQAGADRLRRAVVKERAALVAVLTCSPASWAETSTSSVHQVRRHRRDPTVSKTRMAGSLVGTGALARGVIRMSVLHSLADLARCCDAVTKCCPIGQPP